MHPYISQPVITQRIEDALTQAENGRRYAAARAARTGRTSRRHAEHAWLSGATRWIARGA
jgi:hypothetical protein